MISAHKKNAWTATQRHESRTAELQRLQPSQVSQCQRNILCSSRTKRVRCNTRHNKTAHKTCAPIHPDIDKSRPPSTQSNKSNNKQAQQLQLHESRTTETQRLQPSWVSQCQRNILSSFRTKRVRCNTRHNKTAHNTYALEITSIDTSQPPS